METSAEGIFSCGNVLHVHDLVDYVSEEAALAGRSAAAYLRGAAQSAGRSVAVLPENGVRYTVPQVLDPDAMADRVTLRFRVADVYRDRYVCVYCSDRQIYRKKKRIMAPGEMEQVVLEKAVLQEMKDLREIRICTEVASE